MAEKVPTASDILEIVENKLNCAICLQNFTQPKSLPCLHVFCKACLEPLSHTPQGDGHKMKCPICRSTAQIPKEGISGFPDQFHFRDFVDVQQLLKKMVENQQVMCENCDKDMAKGFCQQCESFLCQECIDAHCHLKKMFPDHNIISMDDVLAAASQLKPFKKPSTLQCPTHQNPLSVYCQAPCDTLICHDCTIFDHKDHECRPISDKSVFKKHKEEIETHLEPTKQRLAFILQAIEMFNQRETEISENRDRVKNEIRATGKQMIAEYTAAVQQSMNLLEEQADKETKEKLKFMSAQKEDAQSTAALLQSCVEYVEGELRMGSQQQILASKRQVVDRMEVLTSQVKEKEYLVTEKANIKFLKSSGKSTSVGKVGSSTLLAECKVSGECLSTATIAHKSSFTLSLSSTPGSGPLSLPASLISCQLSVPEATSPTNCNISETAPGKYEVSYNPVTIGPHQLRVRVGNVDIPGSPFTVQVKQKGTSVHTIGELNHPWGVAVSNDGSVLVTEQDGHRVVMLDKQGKVIQSFGCSGTQNGRFQRPRGVAITSDRNVFVVDSNNCRIQKFDFSGNFLAAVGSKGNDQLQFKNPLGICVNQNSMLFVVDSDNHRIQVLNPDLTFSHSIGVKGSQPGQFKKPVCIAIDSKGMLYVTDEGNRCIQKLTPKGEFITQFGKEGTGEGELISPCGITVDTITDTVYVSSYHKVSAFSSTGKFITEFGRRESGEGEFNSPCGLALDESTGYLYVCDFFNNRLVSY